MFRLLYAAAQRLEYLRAVVPTAERGHWVEVMPELENRGRNCFDEATRWFRMLGDTCFFLPFEDNEPDSKGEDR